MSQALSWNALFNNGSIVSLSASLWRASVRLKAEDVGITNTEEVKAAMSLGRHRLVQPKSFEAINKAMYDAKRAVDFFSVNFGLIKGARYVPEKNLSTLTTRLRELKISFEVAVVEFVRDYEITKSEQLPIILSALRTASGSEDTAQRAFARISSEYPSADEVRDMFDLSWIVYAITSPKDASAANFAEQETNEVKSIIGEMVTQLRNEMTEKLKDVLAVAAKGGKMPERSLDSANAMLDRVESLNILGDSVLSDQVAAMRLVLGSVSGDAVFGAGQIAGLSDIQTALEASIADAIAEAEQTLTGVGRRRFVDVAADEPALPVSAPEETGEYAGL